MFEGKTILVTGGTGSFGNKFVKATLARFSPKKIIIFSRDEMKQLEMARSFQDDDRVRFFIGDVRDKARLSRALKGVDIVVHAAATKIVPVAEYDPFECVKTNIFGAMNVIDECIDNNVETVVALSTDKACNPINLYGSTKLCSDRLFIAGNSYSGWQTTKFCVVRYGNVMGSRGSVIPYFLGLDDNCPSPITDERMTRFMISLDDAVKLVWHAIADSVGGEIYVKKIPSMNMVDLAKTLRPNNRIKVIGIRPGEKLHEQMIALEDARNCWEYEDYYKILPAIADDEHRNRQVKDGKFVDQDFTYSSDMNPWVMSPDGLLQWLKDNRGDIGKI